MHFLAQSAHFRTPQDHLAAPGWFFCRHLISRSDNSVPVTRRCQTALRGRPASSDNRLSPQSGDAPETSPFRRLGYSKRQARPPKGDSSHREHAGESRPPSRFSPRANCVGTVSIRLGRRAASVCDCKRDSALSPEAGEGANPKATGSGTSPQRGHVGSSPR
jgi:hypothetical protein